MESPKYEKRTPDSRHETPANPNDIDWDSLIETINTGLVRGTHYTEAVLNKLRENANQPMTGWELFSESEKRPQPSFASVINNYFIQHALPYRIVMINSRGLPHLDESYALVHWTTEHRPALEREPMTGNLTDQEWTLLENELATASKMRQYLHLLRDKENQPIQASDLFGETSVTRINMVTNRFNAFLRKKGLSFRLQRREVIRNEPGGERKYALGRYTKTNAGGESAAEPE